MKENRTKKKINIKELLPLTSAQKQYFSSPSSLMLCILDNSSPEICHQFYETCKYLFNKKDRKPICHNFVLSRFEQSKRLPFTSQSVHITPSSFENHEKLFNNYIISNVFAVNTKEILHQNITSKIMKKVELNIKYLLLINQCLTFEELQLLNSKRLARAYFQNVVVTNHRELSFSKIFETFLNAFQLT